MESILTTVKKMIGITEEYTHFDVDLISHINSVFMTLTQLGVGPPEGFVIKDQYAVWTDFMDDSPLLEMVKSYMAKKVQLLFDPPDRSVIMEASNRQIAEFEWRLNVAVDPNQSS